MEIIDIVIQVVTRPAPVIALVFAAQSFLRLRKTEQTRLADGLLTEIRKFMHEYNLVLTEIPKDDEGNIDSLHREKLNSILDHILGILNWISLLILTKEIKDPELVYFFRGAIIKSYDKFYLPNMESFGDKPDAYSYLYKLYKKFKEDDVVQSSILSKS